MLRTSPSIPPRRINNSGCFDVLIDGTTLYDVTASTFRAQRRNDYALERGQVGHTRSPAPLRRGRGGWLLIDSSVDFRSASRFGKPKTGAIFFTKA